MQNLTLTENFTESNLESDGIMMIYQKLNMSLKLKKDLTDIKSFQMIFMTLKMIKRL